jgi:hypothetical protein
MKRVVLGGLLTLLFTWVLWRGSAALRLSRELDNVVFLGSPVLAIALAIVLVRRFYPNRSDSQ